MTVPDLLTVLQRLPRDAELLAFEPGCEEYCEREVDEVQWQGGGCTCTSASAATTAATPSTCVRRKATNVALHAIETEVMAATSSVIRPSRTSRCDICLAIAERGWRGLSHMRQVSAGWGHGSWADPSDAVDLHGAHDYRHTFATWLEDAGIPARVIDDLMGHEATGRSTQHRGSVMGAHYRHTTPEMAGRVSDAIQHRLTVVLRVAEQAVEQHPNRSARRVF